LPIYLGGPGGGRPPGVHQENSKPAKPARDNERARSDRIISNRRRKQNVFKLLERRNLFNFNEKECSLVNHHCPRTPRWGQGQVGVVPGGYRSSMVTGGGW